MKKISCILFLICIYSHSSLSGADQHPATFSAHQKVKYQRWAHVLNSWIGAQSFRYAFEELILLEGLVNYDISQGIAEGEIHEVLTRKNPVLFPAGVSIYESIARIYEQIIEGISVQAVAEKADEEQKEYNGKILEAIKKINDAADAEIFIQSFIEFYRIVKIIAADVTANPALKPFTTEIKQGFTTTLETLLRLQKKVRDHYYAYRNITNLLNIKKAMPYVLPFNKKEDYGNLRTRSRISIEKMMTDREKVIGSDKNTLNLDPEYQELEALHVLLDMGP
jgi:hypothetical protein